MINLEKQNKMLEIFNIIHIIDLKNELREYDDALDLWILPANSDTVKIVTTNGFVKEYNLSNFNSIEELKNLIKQDVQKELSNKKELTNVAVRTR
ncbi:MAG: hypothetical protein EIB84_06010 [Spiroplasma poulsonii]|uniref:Uncharacterized protein n=1 Tax=Spiroplasma poulsonii TaxID=2138 RepID=A0A2P6FDU7_9MOLU|nr:hypothetical protein [Spiroplasma poulsonii]KAF0850616.1 hypothetical protein MSROBK_015000 [Spiroplasma poulsonii]MBW1242320.1 hypothetical protein [Spiroplasma poulsonii]PQM31628.1 hypothetical protein SMSRO_SF014730 [Spiroplasma poulsonii]PWF96652.1 hypothetical protein SMSE_20990 [Spiroplasma poulsonii]PWF97228.1 hypothetical protein SMH99_20370 [Spiroplasma poulsonii]